MKPFRAWQSTAQQSIEQALFFGPGVLTFERELAVNEDRGRSAREIVAEIDLAIVLDEAVELLPADHWRGMRRRFPHVPIVGRTPAEAEVAFLLAFYNLSQAVEALP
jgi:hypothetical protein